METQIIFYINNLEFNTHWMDTPEAIPNTGEYIVLPQIKGESLVEKIVHRFVNAGDEVVQRVEVYMKNDNMLQ